MLFNNLVLVFSALSSILAVPPVRDLGSGPRMSIHGNNLGLRKNTAKEAVYKKFEHDLMVVYKNGVKGKDRSDAVKLFKSLGAKVRTDTSGLVDFSLLDTSGIADKIALNQQILAHPAVNFTENDSEFQLTDSASYSHIGGWGAVFASARTFPLPAFPPSQSYNYSSSGGQNIRVYVIDTGINANHVAFTGRLDTTASRSFVTSETNNDVNGHGTHVAGTVLQAAPKATIVAYKVFPSVGGAATSVIVNALNAAVSNCNSVAGRKCVINMSLGGPASSTMDSAVVNARNAGLIVVVAAGNSWVNPCSGMYASSPARVTQAITVGSVGWWVPPGLVNAPPSALYLHSIAEYSNFGSCLDIFAPGSNITAAWIGSRTSTNMISGTSMASPRVAGVVALLWSKNTAQTASQIETTLLNLATTTTLSQQEINTYYPGSPNRLLYNGCASSTCA
jgi:subtilisin family serine protease